MFDIGTGELGLIALIALLVLGPERLPGPRAAYYLGLQVPLLILDPFQASAVARLRLVALAGPHTIMRAP